MNKIYFALSARYPTSKAYGVTTARTSQAAHQLGFHSSILCPSNFGIDDYSNSYSKILPTFLLRFIEWLSEYSEFLAFRIQRISCSVFLTLIAKREKERSTFWCRDIQLVWPILIFTRHFVIFEAHSRISKTTLIFLKLKAKSRRIVLGVLTYAQVIEQEWHNLRDIIFQLPMASPQEFFNPQIGMRDMNLVGYIGKGLSSGNDNGLLSLLDHILYCQSKDKDIKFLFVGIEPDFQKVMEAKINKIGVDLERISFKEHVTHEEVLRYLSEIRFGIVPYPDSLYNSQRFPIKAVEYSAAKVNIIANDTYSLRYILSDNNASYFNINEPKSLYVAIQRIRKDPDLEAMILRNAHSWALTHTYQSRVKKAFEKLDQVNGRMTVN